MALVDLVMPKMGESIMEATILKWHKKPGDTVKQDETVLEIATDKVDTEVPSVTEGVVEELLFHVNDVVPIGSVCPRIRTAIGNKKGSAKESPPVLPAPPIQTDHATTSFAPANHTPANYSPARPAAGARFYSPLVLNIAANEGVPLSELESIPGSGNEGRVTKKDILQYVSDRRSGNLPPATPIATHTQGGTATATVSSHTPGPTPAAIQNLPAQTPMPIYSGHVEIVEMDRMRRLIADHMVRSVHTSPHVTSVSEADGTHPVNWRKKVKKEFEKRKKSK